jgi:hypothetical protein
MIINHLVIRFVSSKRELIRRQTGIKSLEPGNIGKSKIAPSAVKLNAAKALSNYPHYRQDYNLRSGQKYGGDTRPERTGARLAASQPTRPTCDPPSRIATDRVDFSPTGRPIVSGPPRAARDGWSSAGGEPRLPRAAALARPEGINDLDLIWEADGTEHRRYNEIKKSAEDNAG